MWGWNIGTPSADVFLTDAYEFLGDVELDLIDRLEIRSSEEELLEGYGYVAGDKAMITVTFEAGAAWFGRVSFPKLWDGPINVEARVYTKDGVEEVAAVARAKGEDFRVALRPCLSFSDTTSVVFMITQ